MTKSLIGASLMGLLLIPGLGISASASAEDGGMAVRAVDTKTAGVEATAGMELPAAANPEAPQSRTLTCEGRSFVMTPALIAQTNANFDSILGSQLFVEGTQEGLNPPTWPAGTIDPATLPTDSNGIIGFVQYHEDGSVTPATMATDEDYIGVATRLTTNIDGSALDETHYSALSCFESAGGSDQ